MSGSALLSENTYLENFAGTDQHIVSIEGFKEVILISESYLNN